MDPRTGALPTHLITHHSTPTSLPAAVERKYQDIGFLRALLPARVVCAAEAKGQRNQLNAVARVPEEEAHQGLPGVQRGRFAHIADCRKQ